MAPASRPAQQAAPAQRAAPPAPVPAAPAPSAVAPPMAAPSAGGGKDFSSTFYDLRLIHLC